MWETAEVKMRGKKTMIDNEEGDWEKEYEKLKEKTKEREKKKKRGEREK